MAAIPLDALVPGGIRASDHVHRTTNDGTCSRCRCPLGDDEVPLMIWLPPGSADMLVYCAACISDAAHAALATLAPAEPE